MVGAAAVAGAAPSPSGLARLAQGLAGVGSKFAPAFGAAKAAAPAAQGALQGVGMGAGFAVGQLAAQPVKGFVGFFANFIPENIYGWFLWMGAFIYWLDWQTGFNAAATANFHLGFAIAAFLLIGLTQRFLNATALLSTTGIFLSLIGFINATDIRGRGFAAVAFIIAFYFYSRVSAPGFFKALPIIAFVDVYGMPVFRDVVLGYAANINYVSFVAAFVFNRILFPIWLWFGAIALYENTRVARKVLALIIVFYFVVSLPTLTAAYKSKISALTPEEKEVAGSIWVRFQTNVQRIVSGEFLRTPVASAYEGLERTFGLGEAKEEPKMGLQLRDDPNMPKVFDLGFYNAPAPSLIMDVPNPLPQDVDVSKRAMEIIEVKCDDKSGTASRSKVVEPAPAPSIKEPVRVTYKRPRTAKCEFQGLKEGSYTAEITVKYKFVGDAELSTAFMRTDKLEALIAAGEDPAAVNKIPPAKAEYDNGPVAITWGPVELVTAPASVDLAGAKKSSLVVYVAKSGAWEGEISGIGELTLTVPDYVALKKTDPTDRSCSFERIGETNTYKVKDSLIKSKSRTDSFKFVGDGVRFECETIVKPEILGGADWAGAQFKVNGMFIFAVKRSVSFEVKGCNKLGEIRDCVTENTKCPGQRVCGDGTWSECSDNPGDECPKVQQTVEQQRGLLTEG